MYLAAGAEQYATVPGFLQEHDGSEGSVWGYSFDMGRYHSKADNRGYYQGVPGCSTCKRICIFRYLLSVSYSNT